MNQLLGMELTENLDVKGINDRDAVDGNSGFWQMEDALAEDYGGTFRND